MKQQKNQSQTPSEQMPANPKREVAEAELKRAENEGMTAKPQTPPEQASANPKREVPEAELKRAEDEGMTAKPNQNNPNLEDANRGKAPAPVPQPESVEGEGSYTAARRYREGVEQSLQKGDSEKLADEAAEALDGPEGADLRHAEQRGMMTPPGVSNQPQQGQQQAQPQQAQPQQAQPQQAQPRQAQQQGQPQQAQQKGSQQAQPQQAQQKGSQQAQQKQQDTQQRGGNNHQPASHR
jgi:hypothetical protein